MTSQLLCLVFSVAMFFFSFWKCYWLRIVALLWPLKAVQSQTVFSFWFHRPKYVPNRYLELRIFHSLLYVRLKPIYWDNEQQSQAQSDQCKMQMAFRSARWRWEFLGTAWSNASDANPPGGDTKPPGGNNPWFLLFILSIRSWLLSIYS